jgi:hypothetical protein
MGYGENLADHSRPSRHAKEGKEVSRGLGEGHFVASHLDKFLHDHGPQAGRGKSDLEVHGAGVAEDILQAGELFFPLIIRTAEGLYRSLQQGGIGVAHIQCFSEGSGLFRARQLSQLLRKGG